MDSLGDFLKFMLIALEKKKIPFQLRHRRPWHQLLYRLKELQVDGRPRFFDYLQWDWDGQYPVSPDLNDLFDGFSLFGAVETTSPRFEEWWLNRHIAMRWRDMYSVLKEEERLFLDIVAELAREEFNPPESPRPAA